ncbi:hypothetical protein FXF51_30475 [Nonomuraea sp. PA05]|uniref:hypothetical protein n=1 Tax=Nonomuraea sp. PA05 TaxID=2604466 RepID=UPI0011D59584|nr:hypothetical protein [Nonomuraea sp. PA05]TYB60549.1 hypothetical protein FXF51_30475 [Nonomuraea sp. PA05]
MAALRECLIHTYGDLANPTWHFVTEMAARQPYADVLRTLRANGEVTDDTDVNCDVSFTYIARRKRYLTVRLSMVGPYAAILSSGEDGHGPFQVISKPDQCVDASERMIFDVVDQRGFEILSRGELRAGTPITLRETGQASTVYAAFFEPDGHI